jgi:hypothetical protein
MNQRDKPRQVSWETCRSYFELGRHRMVKSIGTLASESSVGYVYKRWSRVFRDYREPSGFKTAFFQG